MLLRKAYFGTSEDFEEEFSCTINIPFGSSVGYIGQTTCVNKNTVLGRAVSSVLEVRMYDTGIVIAETPTILAVDGTKIPVDHTSSTYSDIFVGFVRNVTMHLQLD